MAEGIKKKTSTEILNTINFCLYKQKLILPKQKIIIGLSGGQDSICLVFILLILQNQWNCKIAFTSCNHLWQKDSFEVMRQIQKISFLFCIKIFLLITSKKLLKEQKARNWRHYSWQRLLVFSASNCLLTGHTASDRIETILFQLMRGSGAKGILSLYWQKAMFNPLNNKSFNSTVYKFKLSYPTFNEFCPVKTCFDFSVRKQEPIMNNFLQKNLQPKAAFICDFEMVKKLKKQANIGSKKNFFNNCFRINLRSTELKRNFKFLSDCLPGVFLNYPTKKKMARRAFMNMNVVPNKNKVFNNIVDVPQLTCHISKKFLVQADFCFFKKQKAFGPIKLGGA
jgi:tRNA(Ile)-lysidine synthetase-like protein